MRCDALQMDRPTVYIETSVVSYLAAKPSRHPETARLQAVTHAWWARRARYSLVTSTIVLAEAGRGDPAYASRRLHCLVGIRRLDPSPEAERLAADLLRTGVLPARAATDAAHVAVAAVNGVGCLVSWDRRHITNEVLRPRLERICRLRGYALPVLCPPHLLP
jgi:predicted nucleic acid-binding protein